MAGPKPTDPRNPSGGPRPAAAPTLAFSDLDGDEPSATQDSTIRAGSAWAGADGAGDGQVPDIGPPMYLEDEAEVSTPSWGMDAGGPISPPRALPPPTIIPEPGADFDDDVVPPPLGTMQPGADSGGWPLPEPDPSDRRREPPPDLATLMARAGVGAPAPRPGPRLPFPASPAAPPDREISQSRRRVEVETTLDTDESARSGGLRWRWVMVVLAAAVAAAVLGGAGAVLVRGASVTLPGPVADVPAVDEVAEPPVTDDGKDPLAGRTPPDGRSFVRFTSEPSGGVVRVDNEFVGRTPTTVELAYGSHKVLVTMEGHAGYSTTLEVDAPRETLDAPLGDGPTVGLVTVTAQGMEGADVWVDGRHVGTVPATLDLAPGKHAFRIVGSAGTIDTERSIRVPPSGVLQVDLTPQ